MKAVFLSLKRYVKFTLMYTKVQRDLRRPCEYTQGNPTIVGYMSAPTGLGFGARLIFEALHNEGFKPNSIDITDLFYSKDLLKSQNFDIGQLSNGPIIFHVNAPELPYVMNKLGVQNLHNRKIIAVWAWEQPILPASWIKIGNIVDEVWATSRFLKDLFVASLAVPVCYTPYPVASAVKQALKAPKSTQKTFKVFTAFDPRSGIERKNPHAVIEVFSRCFGNTPDVELTIRVSDPTWPIPASWQDVKNIKIENSLVSNVDLGLTMKNFDCVMSLHRSEGFGFLIATALSEGVCTIFTEGFGSNDFAESPGAYVVKGQPHTIKSETSQYQRAHGKWIDPDLKQAERYLSMIFNMPLSERNHIAWHANLWWRTHYNSSKCVEKISQDTLSLFSTEDCPTSVPTS